MTNVERMREVLSKWPDPESWQARMNEGWRPVAVEWEREVGRSEADAGSLKQEVPFGLKVSDDCRHLVENSDEMAVMKLVLALIAGDHPLSKVAFELNRKGYRLRNGSEWTQVAVFNLLPRLIEVAPRILSTEEWISSKKSILRAV